MGLRARFLKTVLADLPTQDSKLGEPSPRWDEILGGRTGKNSWNHYGRGAGTTCIITVNGWGRSTEGFPEDMLVFEPTPNGGGTKMITAFNSGAKARGWLKTPVRGELPGFRPGDVFNINHETTDGHDGTHVGVVVSATPSADGQSLTVETADGGQGTREAQYAGRNVRTFKLSSGPHPVVVQSKSGPGWLDRWVAVGGDEPDEDVDGGGSEDAGDGSTAAALALLGVGCLFAGLGWYVAKRPKPLFALQGESKLTVNEYGRRKAERFRKRFALNTESFKSLDPAYADVHDYMHTVTGMLPGPWDDEYRVLQYEEDVRAGKVPKPRGLLSMRSPNSREVVVNLAPAGVGSQGLNPRHRFERALERAGFEVTGAGTRLGNGRVLGMDVDVKLPSSNSNHESVIRDLARRTGLTVEDIKVLS